MPTFCGAQFVVEDASKIVLKNLTLVKILKTTQESQLFPKVRSVSDVQYRPEAAEHTALQSSLQCTDWRGALCDAGHN